MKTIAIATILLNFTTTTLALPHNRAGTSPAGQPPERSAGITSSPSTSSMDPASVSAASASKASIASSVMSMVDMITRDPLNMATMDLNIKRVAAPEPRYGPWKYRLLPTRSMNFSEKAPTASVTPSMSEGKKSLEPEARPPFLRVCGPRNSYCKSHHLRPLPRPLSRRPHHSQRQSQSQSSTLEHATEATRRMEQTKPPVGISAYATPSASPAKNIVIVKSMPTFEHPTPSQTAATATAT